MKNIFKLMGIALLASSMLVACGKDDPEDPNNGGNDTPANTSSYKVTFDGKAITGVNYVDALTNGQVYQFVAAGGVDGNDYVNPVYQLSMGYINDMMYYTDQLQTQDGHSGSYYWPTYIVTPEGVDYEVYNFDPIEVSKFDATSNKLTAKASLQMFNYDEFYANVQSLKDERNLTDEDLEAMSEDEYQAFIQAALQGVSIKPFVLDFNEYEFRMASNN